jgi:ribosomal protein L28
MRITHLVERKHPRKGREKETKGKDQSPGKQRAQKRRATRRKWNHYISKAQLVARSISTKEREGKPNKIRSLEEP